MSYSYLSLELQIISYTHTHRGAENVGLENYVGFV